MIDLGETYIVAHPQSIPIAGMLAALRKGLHREPLLLRFPVAIVRASLIIAGKRSISRKLLEDLCASPAKLMATGWMPTVSPEAALVEMATTSRQGSHA